LTKAQKAAYSNDPELSVFVALNLANFSKR